MSQEARTSELREKTEQLCDGPLKHIRAAALAAALVPLASIVATPASAQSGCSGGVVCGVVFNDLNHDGIQQAGEPGIAGAAVTITDGANTFTVFTDINGNYGSFDVTAGDTVQISLPVPTGFQVSPVPSSCLSGICNSGVLNSGFSVITTTANFLGQNFGFFQSAASNPGTGTPGFWKNHPDAWPVQSITIGGVAYTKAQAIGWMGRVGKDKTTTMFAQLVSAELNVLIGNDGSCVSPTIAAADSWMATYGPVGSNVAGSSAAWAVGEPLSQTLDAYNNGLLCAPHRRRCP